LVAGWEKSTPHRVWTRLATGTLHVKLARFARGE